MRLPYLIAEVGLHHNGNLDLAKLYIREAAAAGANAVKFQHVVPETLVTADAQTYFHQEGQAALTQREFFGRVRPFTPSEYRRLAEVCAEQGVDFGCTVFTPADVGWLDPLVTWHKVASADITNYPLLEAVAKTGKPVYLSTGAATFEEIRTAHTILWSNPITVLHCVLSYPTPIEAANLGAIRTVGEWSYNGGPLRVDTPPHLWNVPHRTATRLGVGYSDHTLFNLDVLTTAWLLGASVIEKHFTLDKTLPGGDHYHSMDHTDLRALVAKLKELQAMIGDGEKRILPCEESARQHARRGLYAACDIPAGTVLTPQDIAILRPSARLGPESYAALVGTVQATDVQSGDPL